MRWEVEQKFRLSAAEGIEARLAELGARFTHSIEQTDRYFNHPARDFAKTDEALRLRQVGATNFITYKGPRIDSTTKTRRELELPLPPGDEMNEQFAALLTALGFRPVGVVRKRRRKALLAWDGHDVEAAVDEVEGLGSFLELELSAEDADLEPAKQNLGSLAEHLGLAESERKSYLELLREQKP